MNKKGQTYLIAGTYDDEGGKPSKLAEIIKSALTDTPLTFVNGGYFGELAATILQMKEPGTIYWFADVPNDKEKIVQEIKVQHPTALLVTSKRNDKGEYSVHDIIAHALKLKSNLMLEIRRHEESFEGRVLDPLGNCFVEFTPDFKMVTTVLEKRVHELKGFKRVRTQKAGEKVTAPNEEEFYRQVKEFGSTFHEIIHPTEGTSRFLGNASFRCERGFPSFKDGNYIFVSKRNVDKRAIGQSEFVATGYENGLVYFGDDKPSVDTPIQQKLYEYYKNVRYMIHSHVYVKDAPFTTSVVPCGALEEFDEITTIASNPSQVNFAINLKGHGSIIMTDNVLAFKDYEFYPRLIPEPVKTI